MVLRKANLSDLSIVWMILQQAVLQRKNEGSKQWQNGYPNEKIVHEDILNGNGYVLIKEDQIIAYAAIITGGEPTYNHIKGKWLTNNDYIVVHRMAIINQMKRKGVATKLFQMIEKFSIDRNIKSIRVDTNFDNLPMLKIFSKLEYTYCGEVFYDGDPRRAYEKVL